MDLWWLATGLTALAIAAGLRISERGHPKMTDTGYTPLAALPRAPDDGMCNRCGALVLDRDRHTGFHEELDELVDVTRTWTSRLAGPPPEQDYRALGLGILPDPEATQFMQRPPPYDGEGG